MPKSGRKIGRPPIMTREEKIVAVRKYTAHHILETGVIPTFRQMAEALNYSTASGSNVYKAIRNLGDDSRLIVIKTAWSGAIMPVEVFDAIQQAAQEVLDGYPSEE